MIVTEDAEGRQVITYTIPPEGLDDEVTLRLQVTWLYLLGQFWAYPAVVVILLILLIRRRRKKKKKKRAARESKNSLQGSEDGIVRIGLCSDGWIGRPSSRWIRRGHRSV